MKRKYGVTDNIRKISVDEITLDKISKIFFVAWNGKILFYDSKKDRKS